MDYDKVYKVSEFFLKEAKKKSKKKKKPWSDKPIGWDNKSVKQYAKTMMKDEEHPFTACVEKMKDHFDDPKAFCGSVKGIFNKSKKKK